MAIYLSPKWLRDFDDAVRADAALSEACLDVQLVIQYEIGDEAVVGNGSPSRSGSEPKSGLASAPNSEPITYAVRFEAAGASVVPGPADDADIVFAADRATATAIAQGEASAQRAVIDGRLSLTGSTTTLLGRSDLLDHLGSVLESLRANTTWPG